MKKSITHCMKRLHSPLETPLVNAAIKYVVGAAEGVR